MTVIRDDRASGITVVFLGRLFAFHERDQVLGGDRYLLTDSGRCFTGRDTGYITQRNDVLVFLMYQGLFIDHYPCVRGQFTFCPT